ncbi:MULTISPECIES: (2Fe-2S)-binding protein [Providencia]|uniref:(2Fe-2S)-binding protein n=2 Tax=Morganellaceae TaxID=1903414 RepID=UPI00029C111C|nr:MULTISPECIES: (2Fe-2S)-binding protein [Providencia]EKT55302.1 2Fe-2S iron-sulfur cluster binding domain-containing protein [Providencia rettgeri Dmel1]ELH9584797.1 (2Fe-2S)-binding protein [Providencia rettgeri]ELM3938552.1 (2Fe-2S)-binding protein [Providencia rettgeri]ELR5288545.1 (2Fe-2S)-binding protein [Providencia rettgeri]ELR5295624.1 (2Fe-2S)-binding protein [Providencia rettgeri]
MQLNINGRWIELSNISPSTPLLYVLRNDLKLNGPKYGCGLGECGACSVLIDGKVVRSCSTPVSTVENRKITTLEGISDSETLHPVQQGFIDEQAAQCGYCTNGMIMTLVALFKRTPNASEEEIKKELAFNLCRCGTHVEILKAAKKAKMIIAQGGKA